MNDGLTFAEIGQLFGITWQRVQQIERGAIDRIRLRALPWLDQFDPVAADRLRRAVVSGQVKAPMAAALNAAVPAIPPVPPKHLRLLLEIDELAKLYREDGQPEIAAEIETEAETLRRSLCAA
jgi:hypothetical protein